MESGRVAQTHQAASGKEETQIDGCNLMRIELAECDTGTLLAPR